MSSFARSTDYALIRELLTDPRCHRRMTGGTLTPGFEVGPCPRIEYVIAREDGEPVAVFLLVDRNVVHFCFAPQAWGRTTPIAREFLAWAWANTQETVLFGPVPAHNRLALKLAKAVGFKECGTVSKDPVLLEIRKP